MSRTYRRKGYEKTCGDSWSRRGSKFGGLYTKTIDDPKSNYYFKYLDTYRAMTQEERDEKYWDIHRDDRCYWTHKWTYRVYRESADTWNKEELLQWLKDDEYEPQFFVRRFKLLYDYY